ncbi:(Fe-S)-binding protein [Paroceanicella profunda]|uniref:(Fe-S)-binding protein n=1 Tax=Paroceanicella profunda TaxID=2579971 RepID=A0A5B8FGY7_9RHOB|nr:(Fe-S)-binding protein [Paroceanicella profunda]QDL91567.1 (Fe-S)-binding protein [Paroceanicella profunda]
MPKPTVALFVTCLVDMFRPSVAFATIKLLEQAGCRVEVPAAQTCCGQPAWNSGDTKTARSIARQVIAAFEGFDHVVAPSGSCGATIAKDYAQMFEAGDPWAERARALGAKTHEITSFLSDVMGVQGVTARLEAHATYHDSCSGLRSLGVREQPRALLGTVEGLKLTEMKESEVCCGFGGTFCVKYPEISNAMVGDKTRNAADTGAELLLAGDLGCLMNMAGKASREGRPMKARHVVEVLAGMTDTPAIGEGE